MNHGTPAIPPQGNQVPVFTEQDVRDYLSGHMPLLKINRTGWPTITRIVFTTVDELDRACGERYYQANYPVDLPICYVELSGDFRVSGPPSFREGSWSPSPVTRSGTACIIFDARTGNHLGNGMPARAQW